MALCGNYLIQKGFATWHGACMDWDVASGISWRLNRSAFRRFAMFSHPLSRLLLAAAFVAPTTMLPATPAQAAPGVSQGKGVKCVWVLVSSANGSNVYQQYCYRGV
jgi:hypothetical protein